MPKSLTSRFGRPFSTPQKKIVNLGVCLTFIIGLLTSIFFASISHGATTGAPSAPLSVTASAGSGSITMSWLEPASGATPTITGYQVEYSTLGTDGNWTTASSSISSSATSYTISGLSANTTYYTRIAAKYASGLGAYGYPWTKVYETSTPYRSNTGEITYSTNNSATLGNSNTNFTRVRYEMTKTTTETKRVYADFYKSLSNSLTGCTISCTPANLNSIGNLQVPSITAGTSLTIGGDVSDLTVYSDDSNVINGHGFTGRVELWGWNYDVALPSSYAAPAGTTSGSGLIFDQADTPYGSSIYGSFQLHNVTSSNTQTVFAWNHHSNEGTYEVGFGSYNRADTRIGSDWTFCRQYLVSVCPVPSAWSLGIYANIPVTTRASVTVGATLEADTTSFTALTSSGTTPSISGYSDSATIQVTVSASSGFVQISTTSGLTAPTGYTSAEWTASNSTVISFTGLQTDVSAALATLKYKAARNGTSPTISITTFEAGPAYSPDTGHFYQIVDNGSVLSWEQARCLAKYTDATYNAASANPDKCDGTRTRRTFAGLSGYLSNISSEAEHLFLAGKLSTTGWIGGSDIQTEGTWKWMDGPEAGQVFWVESQAGLIRRTSQTITVSGTGYENAFNYWSDGEPNNASGLEHYAEFGFGSSGTIGKSWNDCQFSCNRTKYVIEYGESGETTTSASASISVSTPPLSTPAITSITPSSGTTSGGTSITILGAGFVSGATITIGGNAATSVTFLSSTSLTAVTPSGTSGAKNVVVTNPDTGSVTSSGGFTYFVPVTITYNSNANQHQNGAVSGTVPTTTSHQSGTIVTVSANTGNLKRQGFTFSGWNTASDGSGTTYAAGTGTFTIASNTTLYAKWTIPSSARLIGAGNGEVVSITNPNNVSNGSICVGASANIRGITTDGSYVYFRPSGNGGYICKVNMNGVLVEVKNIGSTLATLSTESLSLTYASNCIFIRESGLANSKLYCIDISDWTINEIATPTGKKLLAGQTWLTGNLIDFPDGRIGAVSANNQSLTVGTGDGQCPSGTYCKILRLYTISGTGKSMTLAFSEDIVLSDSVSNWPDDDHGIATDGTYLYQSNFNKGYKVWALESAKPSYVVFDGGGTGTCTASAGVSGSLCQINQPINPGTTSMTNATYFAHNHITNQYIMGDYAGNRFYRSASDAPPAGPGTAAETPTISVQPADSYKDTGSSVTLSVTVTSPTDGGTISYQWRKDGAAVSGAITNSLTINPISISDYANYSVLVTNTLGSKSTSITSNTVELAPIQKPVAPAAPSATAGAGQVSLTWSAPNNRGAAISDYVIQYSINGSSWTTFDEGVSASANATITGLINGTLYYFKVAAINEIGTSDYSVSSTATPVSNNANLSGLSISVGTLGTFSSSTTSYTVSVGNSRTTIKVTPIAEIAGTTINVSGSVVTSGQQSSAINLNVGSNTITIITTAANGVTTKTYTITVTRASTLSTDSALTNLEVTTASIGTFNSSTFNYAGSVSNATSTITVTPTASESNSSITLNGTLITSGNSSSPISLNVGSNVFTLVVTAEDGISSTTYTITINRASSGREPGSRPTPTQTPNPTTGSGTGSGGGTGANSGGASGGGTNPSNQRNPVVINSTSPNSVNIPQIPITAPVTTTPTYSPITPNKAGDLTVTTVDSEKVTVEQIVTVPTSQIPERNIGIQVSGSSWSMSITAARQIATGNESLRNNLIPVEQNGSITTFGAGFKPLSQIDIYLLSNPKLLGSVIADSEGNYLTRLQIPANFKIGIHTFQALGKTKDDVLRRVDVPIKVIQGNKPITQKKFKIYFDANSFELDATDRAKMLANVQFVRSKITKDAEIKVEITGYVQTAKVSPFTKPLSDNRSKAIAKYMRNLGLKADYVVMPLRIDKRSTADSRRASIKVSWILP